MKIKEKRLRLISCSQSNKLWEFNTDVYQTFANFEGAYDSIDSNILYKIKLNNFEIPTKLIMDNTES